MAKKSKGVQLVSWNVNGIRAAHRGGFLDWFAATGADVVCVQEIKAFPAQLPPELRHPGGFHAAWYPAKKPGYSGVATFSREEPLEVREGIGIEGFDAEGRVLVTEFPSFTLVNTYFPNSQRDHARLGFKVKFCHAMRRFCDDLRARGKTVIVCGDFNIAHKEIDLRNPKTNVDNAGFLPEERAWMDEYVGGGYVDTFRAFEPGPENYTWWSYRPGVRAKNIGWRLDYFFADGASRDRLAAAAIHPEVEGSDHCPVSLWLRN